jgi:peroxiredoxin
MSHTVPGLGVRLDKTLPTGSLAAQFILYVTPNQTLSLRELLGGPFILAFYPDWSPVCVDQDGSFDFETLSTAIAEEK